MKNDDHIVKSGDNISKKVNRRNQAVSKSVEGIPKSTYMQMFKEKLVKDNNANKVRAWDIPGINVNNYCPEKDKEIKKIEEELYGSKKKVASPQRPKSKGRNYCSIMQDKANYNLPKIAKQNGAK